MERPGGVTAVAVLLWLTGLANLIGGLSVMSDVSTGYGLIQIVIGALAVAFGIGCWRLQQWAWMGTIVLMAVNAVSIIAIWVQYSDRIIVSRVALPLIINVVVIFYLIQPQVKVAFRR